MPLLHSPHHDGSPLYLPDGEPAAPGGTAAVRLWVPHRPGGVPGAQGVVVRSVRDGEPALTAATVERTGPAGTWWRARVPIRNPVTGYRFLLAGPGGGYAWLNGTGLHRRDVTDAADFRLVTHPAPPDWVADQVGYQVFPDRFARAAPGSPDPATVPDWALPAGWDDPVVHRGPDTSRQLYGGDLDGVTAHLDHLVGLGATLLYLTPFFEGRSNHRYDAVGFDRVDPLLGGDAALDRLLTAAARRGIRVLGDLTTNHTGVGHEWFVAALGDPRAVEAGFYRFRSHPGDYESWLDVASLPALDHGSAELARRLYAGPDSVAARWVRAGLAGWRIDVANMTGRAGTDDHAHAVARALRGTLAAVRPDAWLVAEHGHDAALDLAGDGWHGTMDYAGFTRPLWAWLNGGAPGGPGLEHGLTFLGVPVPIPVLPASAVVATMREVHAAMPWRSVQAGTLHLDSHDTARMRTVTGGGTGGGVDRAGTGRGRHLVAVAAQLTLPGVPCLFAGDELGLTAVDGEHARTPFPWHRRDDWDAATLDAYRAWIGLRHRHVALRRGGLRWLAVGVDSMTYLREHPDERVLVHLARAGHAPVRLPLAALGLRAVPELEVLVGQAAVRGAGRDGDELVLPADGPAAHAYRLPGPADR